MKKGSHAVYHGPLHRRRSRRLRRSRSAHNGRLRRRGRRHNLTLNPPLKYQRWPHSYSPHDRHQPRVRLRLHLRARIKSQWRHIHRVNRLFLLRKFFTSPARVARILRRFVLGAFHASNWNFIPRHWNRGSLRDLQFASAVSRAIAQRIDLPVRQRHVSALRHYHALPAQLLLQAHRATIRPNANHSRALESHKKISRLISYRYRLPLNLRGVDAQRQFALQSRMDRSAFQRHRHRSARLQNRKARRPANRNLTALHKANPRASGLHSHVAPAPQNRLRHSANNFHAHRSRHSNVFAFDQSHRIAHWLIRSRRRRNKNPRANHRAYAGERPRAPQRFAQIIRRQHSQSLSSSPANKLSPILYVTRLD